MKILHLSTSDVKGGAAKAAYRIHKSLLLAGIDSQMLVALKYSDDKTIIAPNHRLWSYIFTFKRKIDKLPLLFCKKKPKGLFSPSWVPTLGFIKKINTLNPDVVHLHWIQSGMIRIEDIKKIKAPIVWTCHDMWPFTGGYHHDEYYDAETLHLNKKKENYVSKHCFKRKKRTYDKKRNITLIGLSTWMYKCITHSKLLGNFKSVQLPNPIDVNLFCPSLHSSLRASASKKRILFGAVGGDKNPIKGGEQLINALKRIKSTVFEVFVFGTDRPQKHEELSFEINYLGHIKDEFKLAEIYNSVDVMVVPSLLESFGQIAVEALSCGVPVVAFDTSGLRDIIDHKINGYLAKPFDTDDLARGIEWILNHLNPEELSKQAREKVLKQFDQKVVVKKYIQLYKSILSKESPNL